MREQIIRQLIATDIAKTREDVIAELVKIGMTARDAAAAYVTCEQKENASPRSFWGIAQGITRVSQQTAYQDERFELDALAARVLAKGRKLVAA